MTVLSPTSRSTLAQAREALEHIDEWCEMDGGGCRVKVCRWCYRYESQGHKDNCLRVAALAALDAEPPASPAPSEGQLRWRKKPVVIEAFQMTEERHQDNSEWPNWLHAAWQKEETEEGCLFREGDASLHISTLEGTLAVSPGDWIIQGIKGELYPHKPDIFDEAYEAASPPPSPCSLSEIAGNLDAYARNWDLAPSVAKTLKGHASALRAHAAAEPAEDLAGLAEEMAKLDEIRFYPWCVRLRKHRCAPALSDDLARAIAYEAHMLGRIYNKAGEPEKPAEVCDRLDEMIAAERRRAIAGASQEEGE